MNKIIFIMTFMAITSCKSSQSTSDLIKGVWQGVYLNKTSMELQINESEFIEVVDSNGAKTKIAWEYELLEDTLVLRRKNARLRKHIVSELTDNNLEFKPLLVNQVDISLIESITFKKSHNE